MKQDCSYGEKYLGKKKKYHLVETSLYPYVSQILATVKALLFAFLPIQIKDFHTQVL